MIGCGKILLVLYVYIYNVYVMCVYIYLKISLKYLEEEQIFKKSFNKSFMNVMKFEIRKNINEFLYFFRKQSRHMSSMHRDGIQKKVILGSVLRLSFK